MSNGRVYVKFVNGEEIAFKADGWVDAPGIINLVNEVKVTDPKADPKLQQLKRVAALSLQNVLYVTDQADLRDD